MFRAASSCKSFLSATFCIDMGSDNAGLPVNTKAVALSAKLLITSHILTCRVISVKRYYAFSVQSRTGRRHHGGSRYRVLSKNSSDDITPLRGSRS